MLTLTCEVTQTKDYKTPLAVSQAGQKIPVQGLVETTLREQRIKYYQEISEIMIRAGQPSL